MKKLTALFLALTLCLGCFAACGTPADEPAEDNDDEEKTFDYTTEPTTDSATDPTADPTTNPTEDDPAEKIVVVGYTIFELLNYKDADGNLVGFDTELAEAVFSKLGYKVVFREIIWDNKYDDLDSGAIDCVWNGFESNVKEPDGTARTEKVDFSYNYIKNQTVIVVKKGSGIKTAEDMKGKKGAAETGTDGEFYVMDIFGESEINGFVTQDDCVHAVVNGSCDFAALDEQLAKNYCGKGELADLEIVEDLSSVASYFAVGFKKGSALTAEVNAALEELAADGTIARLAEKYGLSYSVITDFSDQKK